MALSLCSQGVSRANGGACPWGTAWRPGDSARDQADWLRGGAWTLVTRVTSSHFLPCLLLQLPGKSLASGRSIPRWTGRAQIGHSQGGFRERSRALPGKHLPHGETQRAVPSWRASGQARVHPLHTHTQSHTHTLHASHTPWGACPFPFPLSSLNRQAGPGALVLPSTGSPWARKQQWEHVLGCGPEPTIWLWVL